MAMPPLNGLSPLTSALFPPIEELSPSVPTPGSDPAGPAVQDTLELSARAEQLLKNLKDGASVSEPPSPGAESAAGKSSARAVSVTISAQGREALGTLRSGNQAQAPGVDAAARTTEAGAAGPAKDVLATATLNSGATVSVYATKYAEGEEKPFLLAPDQKIMAEITRSDGSTQTLAIRANTVISEDESGNLVVHSGPEKYKTSDRNDVLNGTDGNDVIINLNGAEAIHAGEGNDTIISFNDVKTVTLGDGDNTLTSRNGQVGSLTAGNGNNAVTRSTVGSMTFGNGDNRVSESEISNLTAGDGNNNISAVGGVYRDIHLGNGNNTLKLASPKNTDPFSFQYASASIQLGDGDNAVEVDLAQSIQAGNGNNSIKINSVSDDPVESIRRFTEWSKNVYKKGLNGAEAEMAWKTAQPIRTSADGTKIILGEGDNVVETETAKLIQAGNGNNTVRINGDVNLLDPLLHNAQQAIHLGDGNNSVYAEFASDVRVGNGDNAISGNAVYDMTAGDGKNSVDVRFLYDRGEWAFGNGANDIHLGRMNGSLTAGDGGNTIVIDKLDPSSRIKTGSGNDSVHILGDVYGLKVNLGDGDNGFTVDGNAAYLEYRGGNGSDTVRIKGFLAHGDIGTGAGDDTVTVGGFVLGSRIGPGSGNDGLLLNGLVIDSMINGLPGKEVDEEEKAQAHAEFESSMAQWRDPARAANSQYPRA